MNHKPAISIVIPAYNEEKRIGACLAAITSQTNAPLYEVVVVDNCSTDRTSAIARSYNVRIIQEKKKGYAYALNTGSKNAKAAIILVTDADVIVPSHWIKTYVRFFRSHPHTAAATGPYIYVDQSKFMNYLTRFMAHYLPRFMMATTVGMNMGFRRAVYDAVGGFETSFHLQTDSNFGLKVSRIGKIGFLPNLVVQASGRRFRSGFIIIRETIGRLINLLSLIVRNRPMIQSFTDYR